jgi:hypothetical protein
MNEDLSQASVGKFVFGSIVASIQMIDFDLCLSPTAMKNIIISNIQENLEFVVGGQKYQCPGILAEFLSPRVCLSHSVDPSISEYVVQNRCSNDEFQLFMSLVSGSTIGVTQANRDFFLSLYQEFGNPTVCSGLSNPLHFA